MLAATNATASIATVSHRSVKASSPPTTSRAAHAAVWTANSVTKGSTGTSSHQVWLPSWARLVQPNANTSSMATKYASAARPDGR